MDAQAAKTLTQIHGTPKVQMATDAMRRAVEKTDALWMGQGVDITKFECPYPGQFFHFDGSYDTVFEEVLQSAMEFAIESFPSPVWVLTVGEVAEVRVFAGSEEDVLAELEEKRLALSAAITAHLQRKQAASQFICALQSLERAGLATPSVGVAAHEVASMIGHEHLSKEVNRIFPEGKE